MVSIMDLRKVTISFDTSKPFSSESFADSIINALKMDWRTGSVADQAS